MEFPGQVVWDLVDQVAMGLVLLQQIRHTPCKLPLNQFTIFMPLQARTQQTVLRLQCQITRKTVLRFVYVCVALMIPRNKCLRCVHSAAIVTWCIVSVSNSVCSRLFVELHAKICKVLTNGL